MLIFICGCVLSNGIVAEDGVDGKGKMVNTPGRLCGKSIILIYVCDSRYGLKIKREYSTIIGMVSEYDI